MRLRQLYEDGRIVKGVNTTPDVDVNSISKEAAKFGFKVDKDGRPQNHPSKVKGSKTNVLFNLGLAESIDLRNSLKPGKYKHKKENITIEVNKDGSVSFIAPQEWEIEGDSEYLEYAERMLSDISQWQGLKDFAEALGEIASATEIYVDMDGVLADFFGDWAKLMGVDSFRDIKDVDAGLQKIKDTEDFWLNLPVTDNAKPLLELIRKVKGEYSICSSPLPGDPNSEPHKREWIEKHLSFFPPKEIIITHDKAKYATQPDGTPNILIDDYGVNIAKWEAAGGIGFKHKDHKFERTAKAIKQHMQEPVEEKWSAKYKRSINCNNPKGFSQKAHCAGRKKKESVEENFADGKVKGKSRPGRVKRSGASCNGSVTDLRKRAKNSSGEKAKMYHWCANMKSGKKK